MTMQNRVRELRKAKGLTQVSLAARAGLYQGTLSQLERGKMSLTLNWMRAIAAVLECSPADLLIDADNPIRPSEEEWEFIFLLRAASGTQRELVARLLVPVEYPKDSGEAPTIAD